jgi:hypothetical protein
MAYKDSKQIKKASSGSIGEEPKNKGGKRSEKSLESEKIS